MKPAKSRTKVATSLSEVMGVVERRAQQTNPLWAEHDLWKDLTRSLSGWELDCHVLIRALHWGVSIDGVMCPVKGVEES